MKKNEVNQLFDEILLEDSEYIDFEKTWGALAEYLTDYEHLKGLNALTQSDVARSASTTQSAISRLVRMKGKPTYELLRRLSLAVGGELFITPLADVTVTLPYDLHEKAHRRAGEEGLSIKELMIDILRDSIESPKYSIPSFPDFYLTVSQGKSSSVNDQPLIHNISSRINENHELAS